MPKRTVSSFLVWLPALLALGTIAAFIIERRDASVEKHSALLKELKDAKSYLYVADSLSEELRNELGNVDRGILEAYLALARNDDIGSGKLSLSLIKIQKLGDVNENISKISSNYIPESLSPDFPSAAERFIAHAATYDAKIQALPSVIEGAGAFPSHTPFPTEFPAALDTEISAREKARKALLQW